MTEPLHSGPISTRLQRIAELAKEHPDRSFRSVHHAIDAAFLREAFRRTRKGGSPGIDGQTASEYAENLEVNLGLLLDRFKKGLYRAPPVRRVHIPKGDGLATRPIGIPTLEDKILQRAVTMVVESIYERNFLPCSYGFRPHRSAHDALDAVWKETMAMGGGWVVEADIEGFFDAVDHTHLKAFLDRRVTDGVLRRAIHKWLNAGVMEEGAIRHPISGTPQGGVISPLLANIYLHEVLDCWFVGEVQPRMGGRTSLIRYADDFVILCSDREDAERILRVLPKRLGKYGLRLHPDKTRLVRFTRPSGGDSSGERPGTFDLLGFTHYWGKSRRGQSVVKRRTAKSRFSRSLRRVHDWCRRHRHLPPREQQRQLALKLRGYYGYYGITGNMDALTRFAYCVRRVWRMWLARRSNGNRMTWEKFNRFLRHYPLPPPRVVRSVCV
jgi:RNA-directed DNA polymerase